MIITRILIMICLTLLSYSAVAAPSFNCSKATTPIEQAICNTDTLSEYDNLMGQLYQQLKSNAEAKTSQKQWLKTRNQRCATAEVDCLAELYRAQLLALDRYFSAQDQEGEYRLSGGNREMTVTLTSKGKQGFQVQLSGAGGNGWTCDFEGSGPLTGNQVIVRDPELSADAVIEVTLHNRLLEVTTEGSGFCGLNGYAAGLYLLTDKATGQTEPRLVGSV